ncbi:transcriptional repressor [Salinispirillum marinum]|uniref:Ferric uptake regulation protein n=2 Tax=Saccharospirillaceae TaxID=255527 RepID=A0ABV8BF67_9GAMM
MNTVEKVSQWCAEQGERFTPTRQLVLEILADQAQAVTAYQLLDLLQQRMPQAKPPTVYRALEFLLKTGSVHRIDSQNAFKVCSDFPHRHDAAFFVCRGCGAVNEVNTKHLPLDALRKEAAERRFVIEHTTLEVSGRCADCQVLTV